jgi:hypothetical protein
MKIEIERVNNGFIISYDEGDVKEVIGNINQLPSHVIKSSMIKMIEEHIIKKYFDLEASGTR